MIALQTYLKKKGVFEVTIEYHCDLCSDLITLPQNEYYDTDYQVCVKPMENHYSDGELARKPKNCEGKIYHVCMHCKDKLEIIFKK